jgi:hypothetical protein
MTDRKFDHEPSEAYRQLTARIAALHEQLESARGRDDASRAERLRILGELGAAERVREATPEAHYLAEMMATEWPARQALLKERFAKIGRRVSLIYLGGEHRTADEAIENGGMTSTVIDPPPDLTHFVAVAADTREMTAAQLVRALRHIADAIERDGLMLAHEFVQVRPVDADISEWMVEESMTGEVSHRLWPPGWLRTGRRRSLPHPFRFQPA